MDRIRATHLPERGRIALEHVGSNLRIALHGAASPPGQSRLGDRCRWRSVRDARVLAQLLDQPGFAVPSLMSLTHVSFPGPGGSLEEIPPSDLAELAAHWRRHDPSII